jgi:SAM-dependent methyltransferase
MKLFAPATERNREPILEVLRRVLPDSGTVLEVASGSGEHAVYFAAHLPHLAWQPSDLDDDAIGSIAAWRADDGTDNLKAPLRLDARQSVWPLADLDAVVCINMVHIAPWAACEGLLQGAATALRPGAVLFLYGPYRVDGFTAPSNVSFDLSLRERNPQWGVRELGDIRDTAGRCGFVFEEKVEMPANNLSVVLRRA